MSEGQATAGAPATTPGNTGPQSEGSDRNLRNAQQRSQPRGVPPSADANAPALDGLKIPDDGAPAAREQTAKNSGSKTGEMGQAEQTSEKVRLKVFGQEKDFDLNNAEDRKVILREAQRSLAANKAFEDARKKETAANRVLEALKNNPAAVLEHLGLNVDEIAQSRIAEKLKREMMDPMERRAVEAETARQHMERQLQERAEAEKKQFNDQMTEQKRGYWEKEIMTILQDHPDLPKSPLTVKRVAQNLLDCKSNGYDLDPKMIANYTRSQILSETHHVLGAMSPEQIVKNLPKDILDKIRQHFVAEVQSPHQKTFAKAPSGQPVDAERMHKERKFRSWTEYRDELEKRATT